MGKATQKTADSLVDVLVSLERAASRAVRLAVAGSGSSGRTVAGDHASEEALRCLNRVSRKLETVRQRLDGTTAVQGPQDKVLETFQAGLVEGSLLTSAEFQKRVGWTRQALSRAVLANRILFLEVGGIRAYPAFYADRRYNRKDLETVTKLLGDLSEGSKWVFFTTAKGSLTRSAAVKLVSRRPKEGSLTLDLAARMRTPLEAIEQGDMAMVKRAALGYAQR
jgi:hypothetical protein